MGQYPICKLKWDFLRTSFTACTNDKNVFSAPFGIFYVKTEIWNKFFQKKSPIQFPNGVSLIFKLPFPNGSYRDRVCRALWALSDRSSFTKWPQCLWLLDSIEKTAPLPTITQFILVLWKFWVVWCKAEMINSCKMWVWLFHLEAVFVSSYTKPNWCIKSRSFSWE